MDKFGNVHAAGDNKYVQCNVEEWDGIIDVAAGCNFSFGLKSNGTLLLTGETTGIFEATSWKDFVSVTAGFFHVAALTSEGKILSCGDNSYNQLAPSTWAYIRVQEINAGDYPQSSWMIMVMFTVLVMLFVTIPLLG